MANQMTPHNLALCPSGQYGKNVQGWAILFGNIGTCRPRRGRVYYRRGEFPSADTDSRGFSYSAVNPSAICQNAEQRCFDVSIADPTGAGHPATRPGQWPAMPCAGQDVRFRCLTVLRATGKRLIPITTCGTASCSPGSRNERTRQPQHAQGEEPYGPVIDLSGNHRRENH